MLLWPVLVRDKIFELEGQVKQYQGSQQLLTHEINTNMNEKESQLLQQQMHLSQQYQDEIASLRSRYDNKVLFR